MTTKKTHWRKVDFRIDSLNQIITGLDTSINLLRQRMEEVPWYDGLWFLEDSEPIYGLGFIAFQNYINGSIKDLYGNTNEKNKFYKLDKNFEGFEKSRIELIIGLANYIKHKDDDKLHPGTKNILDNFNLKNLEEITESPIFEGLTILNNDWNLFEVLEIVKTWRKTLFEYFEQHSL